MDDRDCKELKVFIGLGFLEGGKGQERFTEDEGLEMILKKDLECECVCVCVCVCVHMCVGRRLKEDEI